MTARPTPQRLTLDLKEQLSMISYRPLLSSLAFSLLAAALPAVADDSAVDRNSRAFREAEITLTKSTKLYREISEGKQGKVPQSVLDKTRCVAIFPDTVTVSAGLGATHGDGVGFCKTSDGKWENPMFLNLIGGSVGLQAGVKSADLVLYITGEQAAKSLQKGSFKVGGELSAVAGSFDRSLPSPHAEIVAYSRSQGLFMGASLEGVNVSRDDSDERAFYGLRERTLTAKIPEDLEKEVDRLREVLPPHVG
jgi:lipid-binding SYLF domain-containing protein